MLIGQTVIAPNGAPAVYYSPWYPRRGDALIGVVQFLNKSGTVAITCQMQTKDMEQPDTGAAALGASFSVGTGTNGAATASPTKLAGSLELVRYQITVQGTGLQWVHLRINNPMWLPN